MTLPHERLGDRSQRYEVRCKGMDTSDPERECVVGWATSKASADALAAAAVKHPSWRCVRVIDLGFVRCLSASSAAAPLTEVWLEMAPEAEIRGMRPSPVVIPLFPRFATAQEA